MTPLTTATPAAGQTIVVGIADARASADPRATLATYSLGSCIGVAVHDATAGVAGLLHVQLPAAARHEARAQQKPAMFADTGFAHLLDLVQQLGAVKRRLRVTLAGGAAMIGAASAGFDIGRRNHAAVRKALWQHGLLVAAEQVGGNAPRTVYLAVATGAVTIKTGGATAAAA